MFNKSKKELNRQLARASKSDGYLIAVTYREGDELKHHFLLKDFRTADVIPSLQEIEKLYHKEKEHGSQAEE